MEATTSVSKPKSTGKRSQNNHWYGHCRDLAVQFREQGKRVDLLDVSAMIRWSLLEDKEWEMIFFYGVYLPLPWTEADSEHANKAIEMCHVIQAREHFWLREYINGECVKVYADGGTGGVRESAAGGEEQ